MALSPAATDRLSRNLRRLPAVLGVLLLIGAIYAVQKEFRHLRLEDVSVALDAIPRRALVISFLWTILSVLRAHLLRPPRHHLRRPQGRLQPRRLRLLLRLRAVAQHRLLGPFRRRRALPPVCPLGHDARPDRPHRRVLQPHLRPRRHGARRHHPDPGAAIDPVLRRRAASRRAARHRRRALGPRRRLRHPRPRRRHAAHPRPRDHPARPAHGPGAGRARHRRRRHHRLDLLRPAARRPPRRHHADLPGLPRHLRRLLHRGPRRQPAGRHRRVRHRHPVRAGALHPRPPTCSAPSSCSGFITTSSRCSSPARCSPATSCCCAAAP